MSNAIIWRLNDTPVVTIGVDARPCRMRCANGATGHTMTARATMSSADRNTIILCFIVISICLPIVLWDAWKNR